MTLLAIIVGANALPPPWNALSPVQALAIMLKEGTVLPRCWRSVPTLRSPWGVRSRSAGVWIRSAGRHARPKQKASSPKHGNAGAMMQMMASRLPPSLSRVVQDAAQRLTVDYALRVSARVAVGTMIA